MLTVPGMQAAARNTTFELPKSKDKKWNNTSEFLNQSLPVMAYPPGFKGFVSPSGVNSFDGGVSHPHFTGIPQMIGTYPQIMENGMIHSVKHTGRLKFFDEVQNYGFLVVDDDESDLFVHYDDLKTSRLSRDILRQAKTNYFLQFSFDIAFYSGKYKESKKAVNLKLIKMEKLGLIN